MEVNIENDSNIKSYVRRFSVPFALITSHGVAVVVVVVVEL